MAFSCSFTNASCLGFLPQRAEQSQVLTTTFYKEAGLVFKWFSRGKKEKTRRFLLNHVGRGEPEHQAVLKKIKSIAPQDKGKNSRKATLSNIFINHNFLKLKMFTLSEKGQENPTGLRVNSRGLQASISMARRLPSLISMSTMETEPKPLCLVLQVLQVVGAAAFAAEDVGRKRFLGYKKGCSLVFLGFLFNLIFFGGVCCGVFLRIFDDWYFQWVKYFYFDRLLSGIVRVLLKHFKCFFFVDSLSCLGARALRPD